MIKISIPYDITLIWSTKLYLFLFRCISSLELNTQTKSNIHESTTQTILNNIELRIDALAHVYLQLSNDCRYTNKFESKSRSIQIGIHHRMKDIRIDCNEIL